ncbi:MAG: peptide-methionine (S)-S-oxide reductase MsrA [Bdellovibrionota bacterium]
MTIRFLSSLVFGVAVVASALAQKPQSKVEVAELAAGCFWGVEESFRTIPGVTSTEVGYEGGSLAKPSYEAVSSGRSGHAETVKIAFDPSKVSYAQLLDHFFKMHDPTTLNAQGNDRGTQYRSAIFYRDEKQKAEAMTFMAKVEKSGAWKSKVMTSLEKGGGFNPAEDYHQKYLVKHPGGYDNHYMRKISFDK